MLQKSILITDIGSTTTKTLLFEKEKNDYVLRGLANSPTTVEKPDEDVKIGIYQSIRQLEKSTGSELLSSDSNPQQMKISKEVTFLATSSAGGGLQILVIGLTLFESGGSAERAAFGAGGVLLDTIAIDDKRSALEQMQLMEFLHPDIILFSGGIDGGALAGVIRLAEILSIADPKPKYSIKNQIPLIFAGNKDAHEFIESVLAGKFDVQLLPNVRPTMEVENLEPVTDKIHEIFLENVMEQAPGYAAVKQLTSAPIIPTPSGVLNDMRLLQRFEGENILTVDIGGATTDVFSTILGTCYRTVSANYGLSYSIANVLKNCGIEKISRWLPADLSPVIIRNYIYNKMLFPTHIPTDDLELAIEQATAIEAIRMSVEQHLTMHFNIQNLGFLDKLKNRDVDPFVEQMYVEKSLEHRSFHLREIHKLIGSGGIISHAPVKEQAMAMLICGFQPGGITELWRDKDFISPHLGILSNLDPELAYQLLKKDCYEKLAIHVKPYMKQGHSNKTILTLESKSNGKSLKRDFGVGCFEIIYTENETIYAIHTHEGNYLDEKKHDSEIKTTLPLIIDTRLEKDQDSWNYLKLLGKYNIADSKSINVGFHEVKNDQIKITTGIQSLESSLPYPGDIMVNSGVKVKPDTVLGQNSYGPPRLFVVQIMSLLGPVFTPEMMESGLKVQRNDKVEVGQVIYKLTVDGFITGHTYVYDSNVRGTIVNIDTSTGTIIIREIQDYSTKPYTINIAEHLCMMPKYVKPYLKKHLGDFVNAGEKLAVDIKRGVWVESTHTGTITNIDWKKGTMTIQYLHDPHVLMANIHGVVKNIENERHFLLEYEGTSITGIIGFGQDAGGPIFYTETPTITEYCEDGILVYTGKPTHADIDEFARKGINGLIIPAIDGDVLSKYIDGEIGVALTGNEKIPFPIIVMDGFGDMKFAEDVQGMLMKNQGKHAYMRPKTQIRAGVIRPQIIIT